MKYIEELIPGKCFFYSDGYYLVTSDYNSSKKRLCIDLKNGNPRWFAFDKSVSEISIYTIDDDSNFTPINPEPSNATIKNNDIR